MQLYRTSITVHEKKIAELNSMIPFFVINTIYTFMSTDKSLKGYTLNCSKKSFVDYGHIKT